MTIKNLKINKEQWEKTAADISLPKLVRDRAADNAKIAGERIAKKGGVIETPEQEEKLTKSKKRK